MLTYRMLVLWTSICVFYSSEDSENPEFNTKVICVVLEGKVGKHEQIEIS